MYLSVKALNSIPSERTEGRKEEREGEEGKGRDRSRKEGNRREGRGRDRRQADKQASRQECMNCIKIELDNLNKASSNVLRF